MTCIVEIAIPCPLRQTFDYLSDEASRSWQTGTRVKVPFGSRELIGIVCSVRYVDVPPPKLKKIIERVDNDTFLPLELFELIQWLSRYYHHPIGDCFQVALPKKLRNGDPAVTQQEIYWQLKQKLNATFGKKQQQIVDELKNSTDGLSEKVLRGKLGNIKASLIRLAEKQIVSSYFKTEQPFPAHEKPEKIELNLEQQKAVDTVNHHDKLFQPFLLQGITGSGKTEVYLQLTRAQIAQGKQVLILIPEIGLTGHFVERFRRGLKANIALTHSAVSDQTRKQAWLLAKNGQTQVIIGTRSAIFTPLDNPGLIIIDEEHDSSYKQQDGLRYHARNIAILRAKNLNIPIVLGSATPSLESLYQVKQQRFKFLQLQTRAGGAELPKVRLINCENLEHSQQGLSQELITEITKQLKNRHQVLLFVNRRGFAPVMMCHSCSWQAQCHQCDAKMVVHQQRNILFCHHCGLIQKRPTQCPECQAENLNTYGVGTEKIEQHLQTIFEEIPIIRVDRDTTQRKNAFAEMVESIQSGEPAILVGTQMLAKGHDFHNVTLVGIIDADQGLFSADFRATEQLAQSITQVTGRAGRGQHKGTVLIQTRQPAHPFWQQLMQEGYASVAEKLLQERMELDLPPQRFWAIWRTEARAAELSMQFLEQVATLMSEQQTVMILGPMPAIMEKRAGRYRAQLLLSSDKRSSLHRLIAQNIEQIGKTTLARKVRWSIDIDPTELL